MSETNVNPSATPPADDAGFRVSAVSGTAQAAPPPADASSVAQAASKSEPADGAAAPKPAGGLFARLGYAPRDWAALFAISLVVSACGVVGASYVIGQGWRAFDVPLAVALIAAGTVLAAVVFMAVDTGLFRLATRGRAHPVGDGLGTHSASDAGEAPAADGKPATGDAPTPAVSAAPSASHSPSAPNAPSASEAPAVGKRARAASKLARITPAYTTGSIALFTGIMMLLWLPWLIANFPGGTYWDTYYQIFQCYPENHPIAIIPYAECYDNTLTDAYLCDHHPILVTLLYGVFGMASDALTGNWMMGVFAFTTLQGALSALAFTAAVAYLRERGCPTVLCFAAYAFFCLTPFISTWAMCMVKDSLFGALYVPYFLMLFEVVRTRGASLTRPRAVALFVLLGVLLCLTKKQGLFVVVPTALIAAFLHRPRRVGNTVEKGSGASRVPQLGAHSGAQRVPHFPSRVDAPRVPHLASPSAAPRVSRSPSHPDAPRAPHRFPHKPSRAAGHSAFSAFLAQALLCLVVMLLVMPYAVFPLLNVAPGGKQETLGPLFQQTAYFATYYGNEVTDDERAAIDAVLEYDNLAEQYTFDFQDEVKYRFRIDATADDIANYLKVWAAQGLRHPEAYVASLMAIAGYYVAPCGVVNIRMVTVDTHMGDDDRYMLYNPDELDDMRLGMDAAYNAVARTPGVDVPLLCVTYVFWLPAALLFVALRRRLRCGLLFVPPLVLLAFCVVAPVYDARYCVPLLDAAPLFVCMVAALVRARWGGGSVTSHAAGVGCATMGKGAESAGSSEQVENAECASGAHDAEERERYVSGNAVGRHHHGVSVGYGGDGAVHGAAGRVRRSV